MEYSDKIPEGDLKLINDSFKETGEVETLGKDASGNRLNAQRRVVNPNTFVISDFRGRTLKHQKSLVPLEGGQIVIGVRGQKFDEISIDQRKLVVWLEDDFEQNGG